MKRILVLAAIILGCALFFTGCTGGSTDRNDELEASLDETYTNLTDTFSDSGSKFSMIEEYLESWANSNEIKVVEISDHYMVLRNGATEGMKETDSVSLLCPVDTADMTHSNHSLAVGLTSLLGPDSHGRIELIVAQSEVDGFLGADGIPGKYLNGNNIIDIDAATESGLHTSGSYEFDATLFKGMHYESPEYSNAYEVSVNIGSYRDAFDFEKNCPNPIEVIGDYLATCKSSAYLFQLSSFDCKLSGCGTPVSANAVIIIDDNNVSKMQKKFDKSFEKMNKACSKLGIDFVYTFTEAQMPERALKDDDASRIISLLYTIDPGIFCQDEKNGEIIAACDFMKLTLNEDKFVLKMNARSKTKEYLSEMRQTIITTAGLSDLKYNLSDTYTAWNSNDKLASYFRAALNINEDEDTSTLRTSDLNVLAAKKSSLNCIYYGIGKSDDQAAMENIIDFMSTLANSQDAEN